MQRDPNIPWKPGDLEFWNRTGAALVTPAQAMDRPPHGTEVAALSCLLWGKRAVYSEEGCPTEQPRTSGQKLKDCIPHSCIPLPPPPAPTMCEGSK